MQRSLFVILAAAVAILGGSALPNLGSAGASTTLTPKADRTAVIVLAGGAGVAPAVTAIGYGFVRETNTSQWLMVLLILGTSVFWTYDQSLRRFEQLSTSTPKVGSAIYIRPSTNSTVRTLVDPSWAAAITATVRATQASTYARNIQRRMLDEPTFKKHVVAPKHRLSATVRKPATPARPATHAVLKPTTPVAATAKTTVSAATAKASVSAATVKPTTKVVTPTRKRTPTKVTVTKKATATTIPAATVPPTTVPASTSTGTSSTAVAAPAGFAASQLIFNDSASSNALNTSEWNTYITAAGSAAQPWNSNGAGGSGVAGGSPNYDADYDLPGQVSEANGVIDIRATETPTEGMLGGSPSLYPFASGVVYTYGKFEFTGGYVQIEAKMPGGSGMWPGLWMLPGSGATGVTSYDNFEIDIFEGGGIDGPDSTADYVDSWHLHYPGGVYGASTLTNTNLTTGFNTYGLNWVPGQSITWYLNGAVIGQVTSAQATIPSEPMELIMNLQVAHANTSSWHTVYNASTPVNSDMLVSGVQVYS